MFFFPPSTQGDVMHTGSRKTPIRILLGRRVLRRTWWFGGFPRMRFVSTLSPILLSISHLTQALHTPSSYPILAFLHRPRRPISFKHIIVTPGAKLSLPMHSPVPLGSCVGRDGDLPAPKSPPIDDSNPTSFTPLWRLLSQPTILITGQ